MSVRDAMMSGWLLAILCLIACASVLWGGYHAAMREWDRCDEWEEE